MQTAPRTPECTFCNLIRGAAEVSICHEDADAIAFLDIQPVNGGHVLVVPREHYESLFDVPQELGLHLFRVTMRLAAAVRRVTGCSDMNIVVNSGAAAGQDEPHYHLHIIPRRKEDGFNISLPFDGSEMPERTQLDAMAARIGAALRDPMRPNGDKGSTGRRGTDTWRGKSASEPVSERAPSTVAPSRTNGLSNGHATGRGNEAPRRDDTAFRETIQVVRFTVAAAPPAVKLTEGAHGELLRAE
jgi:histidine triad (HIT) family protein